MVPVPLSDAARILRERFPEHAYSARQLRQMAQNGSVPCVMQERPGVRRLGRPVNIRVRVKHLVQRFESWERK